MSKKEVIICDGCEKLIEKEKNRYKLQLKTNNRIWDGVSTSDYWYKDFDFCRRCADNINKTLKKIEEKLNEGD